MSPERRALAAHARLDTMELLQSPAGEVLTLECDPSSMEDDEDKHSKKKHQYPLLQA